MSRENVITLVIVSDNHFAVLLAALLKSIEVNHQTGEALHIYIVNDNLTKKNLQKLNRVIISEKIRIFWIKMKNAIPADLSIPLDDSSFPLNTYMRLFVPYFLPRDIEKAIYLDVDMIVLEDISRLWHTNINDSVLGAVTDRVKVVSNEWGGIKNYKELGLDPQTKYFNAGLMLINLQKWRDMEITGKVIHCMIENKKYAVFAEQYGLNIVLANQWHELDPLWNCYAISEEKNPFLVHFIGTKPIFRDYEFNEEYKRKFFEYLQLTEWKNYRPKSKLNKNLKKAYNVISKKILAFIR